MTDAITGQDKRRCVGWMKIRLPVTSDSFVRHTLLSYFSR